MSLSKTGRFAFLTAFVALLAGCEDSKLVPAVPTGGTSGDQSTNGGAGGETMGGGADVAGCDVRDPVLKKALAWRDESDDPYDKASLELYDVKDLHGLDCVEGITSLSLTADDDGPALDVSVVGEMPALAFIYLQGKFSNLEALAAHQFGTISLHEAGLSDLDFLGEQKALTYLSSFGNELVDIGALAAAEKLEILHINSDPLRDLSPLKELPALQSVNIKSDALMDLSSLSGQESMTELTVFAPALNSLAAVAQLPALKALHVTGGSFTSVAGLEQHPTLEDAQLTGWFESDERGKLTDLTPLADGCGLTSLTLSNQELSSLSGVEACSALGALHVWRTSISALAPLTGLPLTSLTLHENQIISLDGLQSMALEQLNLAQNQVASLAELATSSALVDLNIADNVVVDISALSGHPLVHLIASGNAITDVSPLAGKVMVAADLSDNAIVDLPANFSPIVGLRYPTCPRLRITDNPLSEAAVSAVSGLCSSLSDEFRIFWDDDSCGQCRTLK